MLHQKITFLGRVYEVSLKTAKLYWFVLMPFIICLWLYSGYLWIDAAGKASGIGFWGALAIAVVLLGKFGAKTNGKTTWHTLMPKPWMREIVALAGLAHGLYFYFVADDLLRYGVLATYAGYAVIAKVRRRLDKEVSSARQPT